MTDDAHPNDINDDVDLDRVADVVRDLGYRALIDKERQAIRSATGGLEIALYPRKDNLQIRCGIAGEGANITLEITNDFNSHYRFGKMYIDDDGDVVLESDFLVDYLDPNLSVVVADVFGIFDGLIGILRELLVKTRRS